LKRILVFLLLIAFGAIPCAGEVRLRLISGQVLEGTDVRREGGNYYLTMADGGVIPLPQELVAAVELVGKKKEPPPEEENEEVWPPTGLTKSKPQQLAGDPVAPPTPREQLGTLGEPSKFQEGIFDPYWHPESDWKNDPTNPNRNDFAPSEWAESVIDPEWVPENAYPDDHIEFAPSEFKGNIIDPTWAPQDAFKKKTSFKTASARRFMTGRTTILSAEQPPPLEAFEGRNLAFSASYEDGRALSARCRTCPRGGGTIQATWMRNKPVPSARATRYSDPETCADQLLEAYLESVDPPKDGSAAAPKESAVESVDRPPLVDLPIDLHRVQWEFADTTLGVIYTAGASGCRPINGDLPELLGIELSDAQHLALAASAYNAVMSDNPVELASDRLKIEYAFAVTALLDPEISHRRETETILLRDDADLGRVRQAIGADRTLTRKERKRRLKAMGEHVDLPRVSHGPEAEIVTFHAWSGASEPVNRYEVRLLESGRVGVRREPI